MAKAPKIAGRKPTPLTCEYQAEFVCTGRNPRKTPWGKVDWKKECNYTAIKKIAQNQVSADWEPELKAELKQQRGEKFETKGTNATCGVTAIWVKCPWASTLTFSTDPKKGDKPICPL